MPSLLRGGGLLGALVAACALVPAHLQPAPGVESWLFFDGVCNLCDGFINFVADGDSAHRVKFGAQQKHGELLARIGAPVDLSTVVLVQGDVFHTKSSAALRTLALMDWPYAALSAAWLIPYPLRDFGYATVAKYRYLVFGKTEACRVPTGDFRRRFIDYRPDEEEPADPITGGAA
jgi:predicted DCC family thiol-disulfide oxidoreductase YuxK